MGRGRKGHKPGTVPRPERLELIRRLLIEGVPDWKIRREFTQGILLDDGRVAKCSRSTIAKDLQDVGLEYRALHDNPMIAERVVGAAMERLARIAHKAEAAGQFQAAIRANVSIVDIVSRRSERWARRGSTFESEDTPAASAGDGSRFDELTDDELGDELERRRERVTQLRVLKGGAG